MKSAPVQAPVKSTKRRWAEIALGIFSGLLLGLPLLAYAGIRKISGNKLPGISAEVKRGAAIGLAVAISIFGTIFSGGFAAPTVPAIIAGTLTAVAGVGGVMLFDKRVEHQQKEIQTLRDSVAQLHVQQGGLGQGLSQAPGNVSATKNVAPQQKSGQAPGNVGATQSVSSQQKLSKALRGATKSVALQQTSAQASRGATKAPQQKLKFRVNPRRKAAISAIVQLETKQSVIGGAEGEFSYTSRESDKKTRTPSESQGK